MAKESPKKATATSAAWVDEYAGGNPQVRDFYSTDCFDWRPAVARRKPGEWNPFTAEEITEWRESLLPHTENTALLDQLEVLRDPNAIVSITGQQAGAALGPLYTIYKAFAARHWARKIQSETGRPAVALFWVASDDHDLPEVQQAHWLAAGGELCGASLAESDTTSGAPVSKRPVAPGLARAFIAKLAETTNDTEFRPGVMEALEKALLAEGATFESQFISLACRWLLPLGVVPVVPRLRFLRRRAADVILKEIESAPTANESIRDHGERIGTLGWKPPLHREGNELNAFLEWEGVRGKLSLHGGRVTVSHPAGPNNILAEMKSEELRALLEKEPERFSPNAILRPLVQDSIFPSAIYTAGPTELLYHGQMGGLYETFGVTRPAVAPRPAIVLAEPRIVRAAEKLGLEPNALVAGSPAELEEVLRLQERKSEEARELEERFTDLTDSLADLKNYLFSNYRDTAVRKAAEKLTGATEQGMEKLRERIERHLQTREEGKAAAREKLFDALFPGGAPQERAIGLVAPLLVNYGPGILGKLADSIDYTRSSVQVVEPAALADAQLDP